MLEKNIVKKGGMIMKSIFKSLHKCGWGILFAVLLALFLTGCSGSLNNTDNENEQQEEQQEGQQEGQQGGEQSNPGTSTDIDFKSVCAINDYVVFSWNESTDKNISYYVLDFENYDTKKQVKSEKIQKNGGPYKYKLSGFEIESSKKYAHYSGYLIGYDSSNKKLFSKYLFISVYKAELTNYAVSFDDVSKTVVHSWKRNDDYGSITKINILYSETETGAYTVYKTLDNVYSETYKSTDLEPEKTYWFKLCSYDAAGYVITETSAVSIKVEKSEPGQIQNLKTATSEYYNVVNLTWDKNLLATSYKIQAYSDTGLTKLLFEKTVTENNASFVIDCIESSKTMYFVVKGINEIGEGSASDYIRSYISPLYLYAKVNVTVSENTANSAKVVLKMVDSSDNEYSLKDVTLEYALYQNTTEYKPYQSSNEFNLTGLEFASKTTLKPRVKINYTIDGEVKTYELISSSTFNVETNGFPAPSGTWNATKISRNSITLTYPKLTEEQRCGIAEEDIVYVITAYSGTSTYSTTTKEAAYGEDSVTVKSLGSATGYSFTVYAKKNVSGSSAGAESERSQIFTTSTRLSKPVIKSISEVTVDGVEAPYSNIKVTFDPIEEDEEEEIKYGIVWDIMNEKFDDFYVGKSTEDKEDITQIIEKVNGGNRYMVCLYAYEATEGTDTIVYSAKEAHQLAAVDDKHILPGLYYTDEAGPANAGELVDIVNPATWTTGNSPKSTASTFNWGISNKTGSYVMKFKLTDEMLTYDSYDLKIIFAAQKYPYNSWAINGTTLAYGVIVRLINPVNGNEMRKFVDYTESSSFEAFHVPDVSSTSSYGPTPASSSVGAYINVFEKYMFNNSVYFGIYVPPTYKEFEWSSTEKDNSQNCIAFSYYMED